MSLMKYLREFFKILNISEPKNCQTDSGEFEFYQNEVKALIKTGFLNRKYNLAQKRGLFNILANYSKKALKKREQLVQMYGFAPEGYVVDLTDSCNLKCKYCYSDCGNGEDHYIDFKTLNIIISEMRDIFGIRFVTLSGGEPFPKVIELAHIHKNITFYTYTNGTYISEEIAKKLKKLGNVIPCISLIGPEKIHDYVRGKGSYNKVIEAILHLKRNHIIWGISITESKLNIEYLLQHNFLDTILIFYPYFIRMMPYVYAGRKDLSNLILSADERRKIGKFIVNYRKNKKIIIHDYINDKTLGIDCMAGGVKYFHINSKLQLSPCVFMNIEKPIQIIKSADNSTNIFKLLISNKIFIKTREIQQNCKECIIIQEPNWREILLDSQ